ncbi:zinc ribbon domain-containing protein [Candidatus Saccharibacteria bacterium]|nr:zinc ribbon domain-containing protein [Candidatus Saccharibacteria bacterium]
MEENAKICQSCAMPLTSDDMFGTNADGSVNEDYCKWCYDKGEFLDKCSMEEYIEKCAQFGEQAGMTNEQMKEYCTKVFPTLKRWKKNDK